MNATPPEAKPQYSRANGDSGPPRGPARPVEERVHWSVPAIVLSCGLAGAALIVVAEFMTLYTVHTATRHAAITTVTVSSHNSYAMIPIAALAALLTFGAARHRSRPALVGLGALGVIALLIALLGDLPDSQSSGILLQGGQYVTASSSPSAGLYLETLGAVLLLIAAGTGLLLGGRPRTASARSSKSSVTRSAKPSASGRTKPASSREASSSTRKSPEPPKDTPAPRRNPGPWPSDD